MSDDQEQSICARCASIGTTCCQRSQVFMTGDDVRRIAAAVPGEEFTEFSPPADAGYAPDDDCDPVWSRIFANNGVRRILAHRANGDCCFLTPAGCRLAMDVRPLVCRLYPYEYNESCIKGVYPHLCPLPERNNAPLILSLLGMNREEAEIWRTMLYKEIVMEFP